MTNGAYHCWLCQIQNRTRFKNLKSITIRIDEKDNHINDWVVLNHLYSSSFPIYNQKIPRKLMKRFSLTKQILSKHFNVFTKFLLQWHIHEPRHILREKWLNFLNHLTHKHGSHSNIILTLIKFISIRNPP